MMQPLQPVEAEADEEPVKGVGPNGKGFRGRIVDTLYSFDDQGEPIPKLRSTGTVSTIREANALFLALKDEVEEKFEKYVLKMKNADHSLDGYPRAPEHPHMGEDGKVYWDPHPGKGGSYKGKKYVPRLVVKRKQGSVYQWCDPPAADGSKPKSNVDGVSWCNIEQRWRVELSHPFTNKVVFVYKEDGTRYKCEEQVEAEEAALVLHAKYEALKEAQAVPLIAADPLLRDLPRSPADIAEAEEGKVYCFLSKNNKYKPGRYIAVKGVWNIACHHPGGKCNSRAIAGNDGVRRFCVPHGGGTRCPGTSVSKNKCPYDHKVTFGGRNANRYGGLCRSCFVASAEDDNPLLEGAMRYVHHKEIAVRTFLETTFPEYRWTFDRRVAKVKGVLVRPDARAAVGKARVVIVEIDEHSHDTYPCVNERRREQVIKEHSTRGAVVHLIRFNPDAYKDPVTKKRIPSCFKFSKIENTVSLDPARKADWEHRLETLRSTIQEIIDHRHEDIQLPECLAAEDERYKFVIPIELFYDNVKEKWPNGNKQRMAAYKRDAELRALATASKTTALGKRKVGE